MKFAQGCFTIVAREGGRRPLFRTYNWKKLKSTVIISKISESDKGLKTHICPRPPFDMNTETLVTAVAAIATCAAFLASFASALEEDSPSRGPQPHFHQTTLICPLTSPSTTAWRQVLSSWSSSAFIAALNFDRKVYFETLLTLFAEERQQLLFGSSYRCAPKNGERPC